MKSTFTTLALATLVLGAASTASAYTPLQQDLRNDDAQIQTTTRARTQSGTRTPVTVRTDAGETAPFVFGSTTTVDRPNRSRQTVQSTEQTERRALNVQIRTAQRHYLNLRRAGDARADLARVELERLKARKLELNRSVGRSRR